jgi:hypothetical protein
VHGALGLAHRALGLAQLGGARQDLRVGHAGGCARVVGLLRGGGLGLHQLLLALQVARRAVARGLGLGEGGACRLQAAVRRLERRARRLEHAARVDHREVEVRGLEPRHDLARRDVRALAHVHTLEPPPDLEAELHVDRFHRAGGRHPRRRCSPRRASSSAR